MSNNLNFDFASLQAQLQPDALSEKKEYGPDERFWKLSRGDDDTGTAVIRLLVDKNRVPFVKVFHHQFSVYDPLTQKKRWYIEDSPETIGLPSPVSERWSELYNKGTQEAKEQAKQFARKIKYLSNVKVINDPSNSANNGKIFLWEFGPKLLDKFLTAMNPSEQDKSLGIRPVELYNPMEGANVMLKIKKSAGFFNYDDTQILPASAGWNTFEEAISDIDTLTYPLQEFLEPTAFKSYDELKGKMEYVITGIKTKGNTKPANDSVQTQSTPVINTGIPAASTASAAPAQVTPVATPEVKPMAQPTVTTSSVSSDDDLDFLNDL